MPETERNLKIQRLWALLRNLDQRCLSSVRCRQLNGGVYELYGGKESSQHRKLERDLRDLRKWGLNIETDRLDGVKLVEERHHVWYSSWRWGAKRLIPRRLTYSVEKLPSGIERFVVASKLAWAFGQDRPINFGKGCISHMPLPFESVRFLDALLPWLSICPSWKLEKWAIITQVPAKLLQKWLTLPLGSFPWTPLDFVPVEVEEGKIYCGPFDRGPLRPLEGDLNFVHKCLGKDDPLWEWLWDQPKVK